MEKFAGGMTGKGRPDTTSHYEVNLVAFDSKPSTIKYTPNYYTIELIHEVAKSIRIGRKNMTEECCFDNFRDHFVHLDIDKL